MNKYFVWIMLNNGVVTVFCFSPGTRPGSRQEWVSLCVCVWGGGGGECVCECMCVCMYACVHACVHMCMCV